MLYIMESLVAFMFLAVAWLLFRELRHYWLTPPRSAETHRVSDDFDSDQSA